MYVSSCDGKTATSVGGRVPTILTSRPWAVHIDSARDAIAENHLIVSDLDVCDKETGQRRGRRSWQGVVEAGGMGGGGGDWGLGKVRLVSQQFT